MPALDFILPEIKTASCLFLDAPPSPLALYIRSCKLLLARKPQILDLIQADLHHHSLQKKMVREQDRHWEACQQPTLPDLELPSNPVTPDNLKLEQGRPRMSSQACFFFLMIRGYIGGGKSSKAKDLLYDSLSVRLALEEVGVTLPSLNTIIDNTNVINQTTRDAILDAQIQLIQEVGLDDFKTEIIDSTSVRASSAWPSDSAVISGLVTRLWYSGQKLEDFGLERLAPQDIPAIRDSLERYHVQISLLPRKKDRPETIRSLYTELLLKAEDASLTYTMELSRLKRVIAKVKLKPSRMEKLVRLYEKMFEDSEDLAKVICYCTARVVENCSTPSTEKVLSLADPDAAYIVKGGREPVIGYKPQVCRSAKGFVTSMLVPKGNANDAAMLVAAIEDSINRTGVVPDLVNTDDGYAGLSGRKKLLELGVKYISVSGAKGKKQTPPEEWDSEIYRKARADRSSVESLMFQLKWLVGFGRLMRRGLKRVREELTLKVITFNFIRMVKVLGYAT